MKRTLPPLLASLALVACGSPQGTSGLILDVPDDAPVEERIEAMQALCDAGDLASCSSLGKLLLEGVEVAPDPQRAITLFETACAGDEPRGCNNLAFMYQAGIGTPADASIAVTLYEKSCELSEPIGCTNLVHMMHREHADLALPEGAAGLLAATCTEGDPESCFALGLVHMLGTTPDFHEAARWLDEGCVLGHARACGSLGWLMITGQGATYDPTTGLAHLEASCAAGEPRACYLEGVVLVVGAHVAPDRDEGIVKLSESCGAGLLEACSLMESLAVQDLEKESLPPAQIPLYDLSVRCEFGHARSCLALLESMEQTGIQDLTVRGLNRHDVELMACEAGASSACRSLVDWLRGCEKKGGWDCDQAGTLDASTLIARTSLAPDDLASKGWATDLRERAVAHLTGAPGTSHDPVPARTLLALACAERDPAACHLLGWSWQEGLGGPDDPELATDHFILAQKYDSAACDTTDPASCSYAGDLPPGDWSRVP